MAGGKSFVMQMFTSSNTWTAPAGVTNVILIGCGGGSGGRGGNSTTGLIWGFGGKGTVPTMKVVSVTPNTTYTVTVGGGGIGGTAPGYGTNGGNSLFGSLATFAGAVGSDPFYDLSAPVSLGSGDPANIVAPPSHGWTDLSGSDGVYDYPYLAGVGGGCGYTGPGGDGGNGNASGLGSNGASASGTNYGAGGGGGGNGSAGGGNGGNGAGGFVQVIWVEG